MALSRLAQEFADEIRLHDWSDAPYRWDRAGHRRSMDSKAPDETLTARETDFLKKNVVSVVSQVLLHRDSNLDIWEFAEACGLDSRTASGRSRDGSYRAALRFDLDENALPPGKYLSDVRRPGKEGESPQ
ncbi:hypothetical protein [Nocardia sp. CC227C]|uniref:hypothetical protein n=1 Tax=Nocardia sp. CC227C TaxID=3044562 RepID=UPI00278BC89E|nr:hypothetical protein [Nocardia sp. CC227C]